MAARLPLAPSGNDGVYALNDDSVIKGNDDTTLALESGGDGADLAKAEIDGFGEFDADEAQFRVNTDSVNNVGWGSFSGAEDGQIVFGEQGTELVIDEENNEWSGATLIGSDNEHGDNFAIVGDDTEIEFTGASGALTDDEITLNFEDEVGGSGFSLVFGSGADISGGFFNDMTIKGFEAGDSGSTINISGTDNWDDSWNSVATFSYDGTDYLFLFTSGSDSAFSGGLVENVSGGSGGFAIGYDGNTLDFANVFSTEEDVSGMDVVDFFNGSGDEVSAAEGEITLQGVDIDNITIDDFA